MIYWGKQWKILFVSGLEFIFLIKNIKFFWGREKAFTDLDAGVRPEGTLNLVRRTNKLLFGK